MPAPANPNRRPDIAAALKRAKANDTLTLGTLATIYGVSKARFVSVKQAIPGMPDPMKDGQQDIFPARSALKAMLDYVSRHDAAAAERAARANAIMGGMREQRVTDATDVQISARDLQIYNRLATEIEERERTQREYIPAAEVAASVGSVFSELSEFMAGLSNKIDPNGLLDPAQRALIDTNGESALIGFHRQLKLLLDADVDAGSPRTANGGAGKPRTRRKRA